MARARALEALEDPDRGHHKLPHVVLDLHLDRPHLRRLVERVPAQLLRRTISTRRQRLDAPTQVADGALRRAQPLPDRVELGLQRRQISWRPLGRHRADRSWQALPEEIREGL